MIVFRSSGLHDAFVSDFPWKVGVVYHNIAQIGEHSDGEEGFLHGVSDFRRLSVKAWGDRDMPQGTVESPSSRSLLASSHLGIVSTNKGRYHVVPVPDLVLPQPRVS